MRLGASRFVAGETLDACVEVLRGLNEKGFHANTTPLGEDVMDEAATASSSTSTSGSSSASKPKARVNVAVKLTHLGLDLGEELAQANVRKGGARGGARQLRPHRHGVLGGRRPDAPHLPRAPGGRAGQRRRRAPVLSLPRAAGSRSCSR